MAHDALLNALESHRRRETVPPENARAVGEASAEEGEVVAGEVVAGDPEAAWPVWARPVIEAMAAGEFNMTAAAKRVGIERHSVYRLRKKDASFAEATDAARDAALDLVERRMLEAATSGIPNRVTTTRTFADGSTEVTVKEGADFVPTAGMFVLKRWRPEYRDTYKTELTGADGGPVRIESLDYIDRQIAELAAELARRGKPLEPSDLVDREPAGDAPTT